MLFSLPKFVYRGVHRTPAFVCGNSFVFWTVEDAGPYRLVVYSVVIVRHRGTSLPTGWFVMRCKHLFSAAPRHRPTLHSSLCILHFTFVACVFYRGNESINRNAR